VTGEANGAYDSAVPVTPPFAPPEGDDWLLLTERPLESAVALSWVGCDDCGGVVAFLGVVRDHAEGRSGVFAVDYEAYLEPALRRLGELAAAARASEPALGRIVLWHRLGRVVLGEASVAVLVSAPHRAEAFEASRYLIDELKATLPVWKYEHWSGGQGWSPASRTVAAVGAVGARR
jgi:molybdopterin synthase catalytic subunit